MDEQVKKFTECLRVNRSVVDGCCFFIVSLIFVFRTVTQFVAHNCGFGDESIAGKTIFLELATCALLSIVRRISPRSCADGQFKRDIS